MATTWTITVDWDRNGNLIGLYPEGNCDEVAIPEYENTGHRHKCYCPAGLLEQHPALTGAAAQQWRDWVSDRGRIACDGAISELS
jgi:hypothetical protein